MPIQFDVIDTNADKKAKFFNKFERCEAVEKDSLTDAKITEETKTTDLTDASINPETQQKFSTYTLFTDAVYVNVTGDSNEDYLLDLEMVLHIFSIMTVARLELSITLVVQKS